MIRGRYLALQSGGGGWNMAVDQAIAESTDRPTLRFYQWSVPTLSLGYFQSLAERDRHPPSRKLPIVRRSTGGGAIVHDRELTYSFVVPEAYRRTVLGAAASAAGAAAQLYEAVHEEIIATLALANCHGERYGDRTPPSDKAAEPFLCFQRRSEWDVVVSGYKVVGSAQRRLRGAILQHGSLLLHASPAAPELPGAADLVAGPISAAWVAETLAERLAARLGIDWQAEGLRDAEAEAAEGILSTRFSAEGWLARR